MYPRSQARFTTLVAGCPTTPDKVMSQKQLGGEEGRRGIEHLCHGHPLKDVPVLTLSHVRTDCAPLEIVGVV